MSAFLKIIFMFFFLQVISCGKTEFKSTSELEDQNEITIGENSTSNPISSPTFQHSPTTGPDVFTWPNPTPIVSQQPPIPTTTPTSTPTHSFIPTPVPSPTQSISVSQHDTECSFVHPISHQPLGSRVIIPPSNTGIGFDPVKDIFKIRTAAGVVPSVHGENTQLRNSIFVTSSNLVKFDTRTGLWHLITSINPANEPLFFVDLPGKEKACQLLITY